MTGILLIDKPESWTSNDVVQKLRGVLRERRIGHAGTLDPMATGLLTAFVGRATRAVEFADADAKCYRAALRLGLETNTQDITGTVLQQREVEVTQSELEQALLRFQGEIMQTPPMYSAIKVNGERLYKLARRGEAVERAARKITIHSLQLVGREGEDWILDIHCSKGTYIRTLCHDIGEALSCGGCMAALRRTQAGAFRLEDAYTLEEVIAAAGEGSAERLLLPIDTMFQTYPPMTVSAENEKRIRNGNFFRCREPNGLWRLYSENGEFLALAEAADGDCHTVKSFFEV